MKNIVVMMQKGGVGKTALADELAWSMERTGTPFAFYDLDPQRTALHADHEEPEESTVAIVDTGAGIGDDAAANARDADVIVIPTKASVDDMTALERTRELVKAAAPGVPVIIVQNMWNRFRNCRGFSEWLTESLQDGETVYTLNQTEWVPNSREAEISIIEAAPKRAKIRGQLLEIINAVREAAGLEREAAK